MTFRLRFTLTICTILLAATALVGVAAHAEEIPLTNQDVTALATAGLGDDVVVSKIQQAPKETLEVSTDALIALKKAGISKAVIDAMIKRVSQRSGQPVATSRPASEPLLPEPEFQGAFSSLDPDTGKISPLERQAWLKMLHQRGPFGIGGSYTYFKLKGPKAPVRFKEEQPLAFIVRASSQQIDPQTIVRLYKLYVEDGDRRLEAESGGLFVVSLKMHESLIDFSGEKYGASSFKITPTGPLPAGEYAFAALGNKDWFCFGVDAASAK